MVLFNYNDKSTIKNVITMQIGMQDHIESKESVSQDQNVTYELRSPPKTRRTPTNLVVSIILRTKYR